MPSALQFLPSVDDMVGANPAVIHAAVGANVRRARQRASIIASSAASYYYRFMPISAPWNTQHYPLIDF
jgi:hypothetical protein